MWLSVLSTGLRTKGSLVGFPVAAHAWVVGQVPSGGHKRQPYTDISLSFSLPSPLTKNKLIKSLKKNESRKNGYFFANVIVPIEYARELTKVLEIIAKFSYTKGNKISIQNSHM